MKESIEGIVLKSVRQGERDIRISLLTHLHGRLDGIAKNAVQSRRFGGGAGLFSLGSFEMKLHYRNSLHSIHEVQVKHDFAQLSQNLENFSLSCFFSEVLLKTLPDSENCPELFKLLVNALVELEKSKTSLDRFLLGSAFLARVMIWNGQYPSFHYCSRCGNSSDSKAFPFSVYFESALVRCANCPAEGPSFELNSAKLAWLSLFSMKTIRELSKMHPVSLSSKEVEGHLREIFDFLIQFLLYHTPGLNLMHSLKSLSFIGFEPSVLHPKSNLPQNPTNREDVRY